MKSSSGLDKRQDRILGYKQNLFTLYASYLHEVCSTYIWMLFHWNVDLLVERHRSALGVWQLQRFLFDAIYLEERRSDF